MRMSCSKISMDRATEQELIVFSCLYVWEKIAYALEKRTGWLDSRSLEYTHSLHCAQKIGTILQNILPVEDGGPGNGSTAYSFVRTRWPMGYHTCVRLD